MKEVWKDIEGYKGKYMVSNMGQVKSLERVVWNGKGYMTIPERILKPQKASNGYLQVPLCKDGKAKLYLVHRLVAQAFLENPHNLPQINHIDQDKTNNNILNLEWCSSQYNMEYSHAKTVIGIDKITGETIEFKSSMEVERQLGIDHGLICKCCKGKRKSAGGFYWQYAEQEHQKE